LNVLQVYPTDFKKGKPTFWRKSQIESLDSFISNNYLFPVHKRKDLIQLIYYGLLLKKEINEKNIDVVHCHWGSSLALLTVIFSNKPTVVSFCGSDLLGIYNDSGYKILRGKVSSVFSILASYFSDYNIVKSKALFNLLPKIHPTKTMIIPNGVDQSIYFQRNKITSRNRLGLPNCKIIILFINSAGVGVKNPQMAREIGLELELSKDYLFLEISDIPSSEMPFYYSASDFLLITSRHEGSNNSLKEALFCNLKVVTTRTGDATERLKNIPECYISNSKDEIIKFIKFNRHKQFKAKQSVLAPIRIRYISKKISDVYNSIKI
jgi:glycosyltransferase involved in cell wall biosynthesis